MKRNPQFEINEYEIAKSFCQYFKIKDPTYTCNDKFAPVDLLYTTNKGIEYSIEIKCRKKEYRDQMIEKKKLDYFFDLIPNIKMNIYSNGIPKETQCRYINYIESSDKLIIYDINSRIKNGLELETVFNSMRSNVSNYGRIDCYESTESNKKVSKYVKYIYLNYYQTKDYVIDNYSQLMKKNNIPFNFKPI